MDENLDGSFVGCLQRLMRIGGGSRRGCRIAKVRGTRGVPTIGDHDDRCRHES
jgi:hypothetical protein